MRLPRGGRPLPVWIEIYRMQHKIKVLALMAALGSGPAVMASEEDKPLELENITVEAEKYPMEESEIAASVTVIDDGRIERELVRSIEQLVRYEPGIEVPNQGSRFGSSGIVIRGIGGNRVRVEVDGVPISDAFSIGDFSNASRDFIDVGSLKQVEIVRGPASALFGSNAVGGVVSFVTKDPQDYLAGEPFYADATAGYYDSDSGYVGGATVAGRSGGWAAMAQATWRQGNEREDIGADPHDYDSLNILAKLTRGDPLDGGLKFTAERFEEDSDTDVLSLQGAQDFTGSFGFPYIITIQDVQADDSRKRSRLSLGQESAAGWIGTDYLRWRLYYQKSETGQDTFETRTTQIMDTVTPVERDRRFRFKQNLFGGELNLSTLFDHGSVLHELAYGLELEVANTSEIRDGFQVNLDTGEVSTVVGPDDYPVRDFPTSDTTALGVYLQDRISIGAFTLIPGLRWDRYELDPKPDEIYFADNPGIVPVDLDESNLLPKLGVLWQLNENWQAYGQYAQGFRAPPVNDVNVGFTNFRFGYTALPNPDLDSESSRGFETGLRFSGRTTRFDVGAYHTRYEDFIQSLQVVGFDPVNNLIIFQSVNLDEVEIAGIEAQLYWAPEQFPDGLSLRFAASWSEGDNLENDQPLNSVSPFNAVVGLDYAGANGRWGGSLLARGASKQDRLDESEGLLYVPDGYVVFDATAWYRPTEDTRLRAGLFNLLDEDYTRWLDVAGLPADVTNPERFQSPGFNVGLLFDIAF